MMRQHHLYIMRASAEQFLRNLVPTCG